MKNQIQKIDEESNAKLTKMQEDLDKALKDKGMKNDEELKRIEEECKKEFKEHKEKIDDISVK